MREELGQIFQTGVMDKYGHDVEDSHPSLSAERGLSCPSSSAGSLASPLALVAGTMLWFTISSVNAPRACVFFFSSFLLSVYRVISDCK